MIPREQKFPLSLCMGTFRKFFFVLYSRRPRVRLLVKPEMIGIIDQRILSLAPTVKEKNAENALESLGFQIQIEDLPLKCSMASLNLKNNITGRTA
jgi:hypothetical protein